MEPGAIWEECLAEALALRLGRDEARRFAALPSHPRRRALLDELPIDTEEQRRRSQAIIRDQVLAMRIACRQLHWALVRSGSSDAELGWRIVPTLNCVHLEAGRAVSSLRSPHLPCANEDFAVNLDIATHYLVAAEMALLTIDPSIWLRFDRERGIQALKFARVLDAAKEIAIQAITHKNQAQLLRDELRDQDLGLEREVDAVLTAYQRMVDALKETLRNAEAAVRRDREPDLAILGTLIEHERELRGRLERISGEFAKFGARP